MAKFNALEKVERIEWDFTGVPHVGASVDDREPKTVSGDHVTGTLPEPDPDTVSLFVEAHEKLVEDSLRASHASMQRFMAADGRGVDDDADAAGVAAEVLSSREAVVAQFDQALAALRILGVPADLLEQLPPRYVAAFLTHVAGELTGEGVAA